MLLRFLHPYLIHWLSIVLHLTEEFASEGLQNCKACVQLILAYEQGGIVNYAVTCCDT
jgi:hypothetical protein